MSLLEGLDRGRFDVRAAYPRGGGFADAFQRSAAALAAPDLLRPWKVSAVLALARQMRRSRCEIVHSHLWSADVVAGLAAALAGVSVRIATVHGNYFELTDETGLARLRKRSLSRVFRAPYGLFDRVIAVSHAVRQDLVSRPGVGIPVTKIRVIPNGIDFAKLDHVAADVSLRARLGLPPQGPLVATIANFVTVKGHRWLIGAIPRVREEVPGVTFLFYGAGPGAGEVRRMVGAAGVERNVVRVDERAASALEALALSDIVVVPSLSEGFGLVVLEALASGKPVIASAVGGIPEILDDGRTGLLVAPRDSSALAGAIVSLIRDPVRARALGEAGRARVRTRFGADRMVRAVEDLYVETAMGKGLPLD